MAGIEVHVRGLGFPEGPVVLPDGSIAFVDLLDQKVRAYKDGTLREICTLDGSPNGMRLGPDGLLYVANNGGLSPRRKGFPQPVEPQISGRLQTVSLDGRSADFATVLPGERPWRPNDLIFTPAGDIVFTDPQNWEVLAPLRAGEQADPYLGGQLLLASRNGVVKKLAKMTGFPNGLAFHPDGSLLVNLSVERRILRFPWLGDSVGKPELWIQFDEQVFPDGMVFQGDRLFVADSNGDCVAVLDSTGQIVDMIPTGPGAVPTNLCLQEDTMWMTFGLSGELASVKVQSQ